MYTGVVFTVKKRSQLKIAFVHDWLNGMRGGEKCLEVLCELFPEAHIYTLFYRSSRLSPLLRSREKHASWLQYVPFINSIYRYFLPFFPRAMRSVRVADADVVVSLSHCAAKGFSTAGDTKPLHLCYCFTPVRYLWELSDVYFYRGRLAFLKRMLLEPIFAALRKWDFATAQRVDRFVAISTCIRERIAKYYERESMIIFPPVDTDFYHILPDCSRDDYYLVVSALVPYKRIDLVVDAFKHNGRKLVIVGDGPELRRLKAAASSNIVFDGWQSNEVLRKHFNTARALIFPGKEDFGIVPLEASACGLPVLAFGQGGVLDTIEDGQNGVLFPEQTVESLNAAVTGFEQMSFDAEEVRACALNFDRALFARNMSTFIIESAREAGIISD